MNEKLIFLLILPIFLFASQADIIKLATKKELFNTNEWKALVHYNGDFKVRDNKFLLSSPHTLKNELIATLKAFYLPSNYYKNINEHPQCKFPARYLFLTHELNVSKQEFPNIQCPDLKIYEQKAPADTISLVFASENVKSPISMMGHTFLKFSGVNIQGKEVHHAISFYTVLQSANPLTLLYQNTISGMKGLFALQPYKLVAQNYTQKENRNLWEYQLKLNKYRKQLIYYHVWELKGIDMKYYFTSYNCSTVIYNMLSLANPKVFNDYKIWITPLSSVKILYKYHLVQQAKLFPSKTWLSKMLEDTNQDKETLKEKTIDISNYKSPSKIPDERQFTLSYFYENKHKYMKLSFLPASHLLNDYNREYFGESELKIAYFSFILNKEKIDLNEFTLYGMKLYLPYSKVSHDLSYQFELTIKKEFTRNENRLNTLKIDGGIGIDFLPFYDLNIFALLNGGMGYNIEDKGHILLNPQFGLTIYEVFHMKSLLYIEPYFINKNFSYFRYKLEHNIFLKKNLTLYFNFEKIEKKRNLLNYECGIKYLF